MPNGNLRQTLSNLGLNRSTIYSSKISVPDESFNNSFIFAFQPGFLGALSSLKPLFPGDALLSFNKVKFNLTLFLKTL